MSASAKAQEWHIVKITLTNKTDATDVKYAVLAHRALVESGLLTYTHDTFISPEQAQGFYSVWPILDSISGVGATVESGLVYPNGGSITVDNSPNSLGDERRFIDLLDRYTVINQDVTIWQCRTVASAENPTTEFALVWTAYVSALSTDAAGNLLTFQLAADEIPSRVLTLEVNDTTFTSVPSDNIGKHLPIVFGEDVQVKPILVADDATPTYAYATSLGTEHPTGGVQKYYCRDDVGAWQQMAGEWQQVAGAAATNTVLYGRSASVTGTDPWAADYEFAFAITYTPGGTSYIIHQGYLGCTGDVSYSAVTDATVTFQLLEATSIANGRPDRGRVLRECVVYKSDYATELALASAFSMWFGFQDPMIVNSDRTIFLSVYNNDATNPLEVNKTNTATMDAWYTPHGETNFVYKTAGADAYIFGFNGLVFTDSASSAANSQGLGYASFEVTCSTTAASESDSVDDTDLLNLDYVVEIDGLKDDSGGTITSSANSIITAPHYIAKLITQRFSGGAWANPYVTTSEHSGTHTALTSTTSPFYRKAQGRSTGRATVRDLLSAIMRETYCTLTQFPSDYTETTIPTPLGIYAYGTTEASQATFTDDDMQVISHNVQGRDSVINRVQMSYAPLLTNADFTEFISQGGDRNYSALLDMGHNDGGKGQAVSADSEDVWGERLLADNRFNFIKDARSARGVTMCLLTDCEQPKEFIVFTTPYWKASALHLMHLITLQTAHLPAYFGTSIEARLPYYDGGEVDLLSGRSWRRFKTYKGRIVGIQYYFSEDGPVTAQITAQLLTNQFDPSL